jgi:chromate transport protein ChrA
MAPKIIAFLVTMLANIAAGVVLFFGLLVAMNGYNESDAMYGIISFIALAVLVTLLMSALAAGLTHILLKREFRGWASALIAAAVFSVTGIVLKFFCSIIGVGIAELVRMNF